jgi:hypothetical protein
MTEEIAAKIAALINERNQLDVRYDAASMKRWQRTNINRYRSDNLQLRHFSPGG